MEVFFLKESVFEVYGSLFEVGRVGVESSAIVYGERKQQLLLFDTLRGC